MLQRRNTRLLLLLMLLVVALAPVLCAGGLLDHDCACEEQVCHHESDGPADWCSQAFYVREDGTPAMLELGANLTGLPPPVFSARWTRQSSTAPPPPASIGQGSRIPFPPADLPLRI